MDPVKPLRNEVERVRNLKRPFGVTARQIAFLIADIDNDGDPEAPAGRRFRPRRLGREHGAQGERARKLTTTWKNPALFCITSPLVAAAGPTTRAVPRPE